MIAREGYSTIAVVVAVSLLLSWLASNIHPVAATVIYVLTGAISLLIIFFFRDPERNVPADDQLIIAPADGKIVQLKKVNEPVYLNSKAIQISIFLSPLNVHVNRVPATGTIEYVKYHPGKYLMAWNEHASEMNERADFGLLHPSQTKIFFRQITGFLARRIVYHLEEGDTVSAGGRFGIMKFGSRMDVVVPEHVLVEVKEGDRTVAGESILGRIPAE